MAIDKGCYSAISNLAVHYEYDYPDYDKMKKYKSMMVEYNKT
jgi:hypothetical protein